jgi:transcriptional regulator
MYCPAHFNESREDVLIDLISRYPLATIIRNEISGLTADHIPLIYRKDKESSQLVGHVARSNSLWVDGNNKEHLIIFHGPSHYISPDWYPSKKDHGKVVPTWNYAVVHVNGILSTTETPEDILNLITELTNKQEFGRSSPWQVDDAPKEYIENLIHHIVGIKFEITKITGKWKLSQNQTVENIHGVINGLKQVNESDSVEMLKMIHLLNSK